VILRSELVGLASPSQLSRVLAKLLEAGKLVRVSHGVYAKTRFNKFKGDRRQPVPWSQSRLKHFGNSESISGPAS
jgi:hypothetical protein